MKEGRKQAVSIRIGAAGSDVFYDFDLGPTRFVEIVNAGAAGSQQVKPEDLKLTASKPTPSFGYKRLLSTLAIERSASMNDPLSGRLHGYLYSKYVDNELASNAVNE